MALTRVSTGVYDVTFGGLAVPGAVVGGETIQLSQRTGFGTHCKVVTWNYVANDLVVRVTCYHEDATGPEDHDFRIVVLS